MTNVLQFDNDSSTTVNTANRLVLDIDPVLSLDIDFTDSSGHNMVDGLDYGVSIAVEVRFIAFISDCWAN